MTNYKAPQQSEAKVVRGKLIVKAAREDWKSSLRQFVFEASQITHSAQHRLTQFVQVVSPRTGVSVEFGPLQPHYDQDNDVTHWTAKHRYSKVNCEVVILND